MTGKERTTVEVITPEKAEIYLQKNHNNRRINSHHVALLSAEMKKGIWEFNGESIKFDEFGNLIDGQHRLHAIIDSQISITTYVTRGLENKVFDTIDFVRPRTAGDVLDIIDIPNANNIAATCKKVIFLKNNNTPNTKTSVKRFLISNREIRKEILDNLDKYEESYSLGASLYNKCRLGFSSADIAAYHYYLTNCKGHDKEKVKSFFTLIFSYTESNNSVTECIRLRLFKNANSSNSKLTTEYKKNLLAKGWNLFITNRQIKQINWDKEKEGTILFV